MRSCPLSTTLLLASAYPWSLDWVGYVDRYGFTGQEHMDSGLIRFRFRHLDPKIGRWASFDPLFMALTVAQLDKFGEATTGYAYVANNFHNSVDPLGLKQKMGKRERKRRKEMEKLDKKERQQEKSLIKQDKKIEAKQSKLDKKHEKKQTKEKQKNLNDFHKKQAAKSKDRRKGLKKDQKELKKGSKEFQLKWKAMKSNALTP